MPTAPEPKLDALIQNCSQSSAQACFRKLCPRGFQRKDEILDNPQPERFSEFRLFGELSLDGEHLLFAYSELGADLSERSCRKDQFEAARRILLDRPASDAGIFIFRGENGAFRLSFITKIYKGTKADFSHFRRYTYFVDPSADGNGTFIRQIGDSAFDSLDAIRNSFSLEPVNKEFYRNIQKHFYELVGGKVEKDDYSGCMRLPSLPIEVATNHKTYQEFAVRLLGRVVFCWFLKHKTCSEDRPLIPAELLSSSAVEANPDYYHGILEKLFFQTLNKPMKERSKYAPEFAHLIPYLNGGLFDPHHEDFYEEGALGTSKSANTLNLPDDWFLKFFQTLEQYNFTIDENTSVDTDVSIDPEILGRIFENLLAEIDPDTGDSARKQSGSFYTPREIVDYMVEESLLEYLKAHLGLVEENKTDTSLIAKLRALFIDDDQASGLDPSTQKKVVDALRTIKVLDPACGSGAFPVGILQKMLCVLRKVDPSNNLWLDAQIEQIEAMKLSRSEEDRRLADIEHAFKTNEADYGRKIGIIQNSVYGVDIQPIAIEISKLRFFLTLVVDEKIDDNEDNRGILPLPNLDFKFVCANTLIPAPEIADIEKDRELGLEYEDPFFDDFTHLTERYFYAGSPKEKRDLREQLEKVVNTKVKTELDKGFRLSQGLWDDSFADAGKLSKTMRARYQKEQDRLSRNAVLWGSYKNIFSGNTIEFFDPKYIFPDAPVGFDVTIGNPPYVRADGSDAHMATRKRILADKRYETLWEKWDLFVPFIERGYKLLKPNGVSTMIVSDAYCHSKYAIKSQNWFLQNARILRLDFCGDVKIFDAAVHNVITFYQKADGSESKPLRRLHHEKFGVIEKLPSDKQIDLTHRAFFPGEKTEFDFACNMLPLNDLCYISVGMVINADEKKSKGAFLTSELISPYKDQIHSKAFVEGKNLTKWLFHNNSWLEWGTTRAPHHFRRQTFTELYEHSEKLMLPMVGDIRGAIDTEGFYCNHGVFVSVPWHQLAGVKNRSIKRVTRYVDEKPQRPDLPKREELEALSRSFNIRYLLGVINSQVARDFLRANRRNNVQLYPDDWKKLPIPDVSSERQQPVVNLVDQILKLKRADLDADTNTLEEQLDALVANLYAGQ